VIHPAKPCEARPWTASGFAVSASSDTRQFFRAKTIDADALAVLTDSDLEKLGLPLGDRKRFLKATAGLVGRGTIHPLSV
jgi:hypothetical protein